MDYTRFSLEINKLRRTNKGNWYVWHGTVEGKEIELKGYETWLQVYRADGINYFCACDISVTEFNKVLGSPFGHNGINATTCKI